ncbi:hypothetical protein [Saliphagus infecundisoli]|uniref:Uncharacterized protein n=1 Tax=Saliphagus infecundisoli TaxID=1849069 RepID=A0ABD5QIL4_9EURY|nr:hypothetical protein [Saliphagus infecundisoli]
MITASQASQPITAEFTPEPTLDPDLESGPRSGPNSDFETASARFELFDLPDQTNTSCDYCGKIGFVETHHCESAERLGLSLICTECE